MPKAAQVLLGGAQPSGVSLASQSRVLPAVLDNAAAGGREGGVEQGEDGSFACLLTLG